MTEQKTSNFAEITFPVPWGHISGRWYGDHSVRPLLALHGWLDNCGSFAKLAPLLVQTAGSVLCIDLPGHGYSTHLPPGIFYHNIEYVRAIVRLMKAYNWTKVSLMGHSMGASVVFFFTALYPHKVDTLIGIDSVKRQSFGSSVIMKYIRYAMDKALQDNQRLVDGSLKLQEPPSYSFAECEQKLHEGTEGSVWHENCKYILERNLTRSQKHPEKYYFSRDTRIRYLFDFKADPEFFKAMAMRISDAKIPYLVIKGGASTNITAESEELIRIMKEHNPNFEMQVVAGATHHVHLNEAPAVAALITTFLKRHRSLAVFHGKQQPGLSGSECLAKGKL